MSLQLDMKFRHELPFRGNSRKPAPPRLTPYLPLPHFLFPTHYTTFEDIRSSGYPPHPKSPSYTPQLRVPDKPI